MEPQQKRQRAMPASQFPLPLALMRFCLTFLDITAELVKDLCSVSHGWRTAFTRHGAIQSCMVYLGSQRALAKLLPYLRGVKQLHAETYGDDTIYPHGCLFSEFVGEPRRRARWRTSEPEDQVRCRGAHLRHWRAVVSSFSLLPNLHTLKLHLGSMFIRVRDRATYSATLFVSLPQLQVLDLKGLVELDHALHPLTSLRVLTLAVVYAMLPSSFATLTALEELHLVGEEVGIPDDVYKTLNTLDSLHTFSHTFEEDSFLGINEWYKVGPRRPGASFDERCQLRESTKTVEVGERSWDHQHRAAHLHSLQLGEQALCSGTVDYPRGPQRKWWLRHVVDLSAHHHTVQDLRIGRMCPEHIVKSTLGQFAAFTALRVLTVDLDEQEVDGTFLRHLSKLSSLTLGGLFPHPQRGCQSAHNPGDSPPSFLSACVECGAA